MRRVILSLLVLMVFGVPVFGQNADGVIERCPTLARLSASGQLSQIRNPVFTDRAAARRFAVDCARIVDELSRIPGLPLDYQQLGGNAALAAEFLKGDTYTLSSAQVPSVVTLRKSVKIPPPAGFVYVREYSSQASMPPIVQQAFASLARTDNAHIAGVTIHGRYIALMKSEFHRELEDNLSHEMVHAYLTLASNGQLPTWFQEAAAVYFSIGDDSMYYNKTSDPRIIKGMRLPDDYKGNLHLFQYLEDKVGKDKLYEFIRRAVETGNPDARTALGLKPAAPREQPRDIQAPVAPVIVVVVVIGGIVAWMAWRRRETWDD
jgi:hypothetical protein